MYRVMIIDDEPAQRKLLVQSVAWKSMNLEIVGEASNGIEAINTIDEYLPDIAFVDISMPFMNGIEFAKLAAKRYPKLVLIILTAFDDFEYARACVSLPIIDYLLKPIVKEEIEKVLSKAIEKVNEIKKSGEENVDKVEDNKHIELSVIKQVEQYLQDNYTDSTINLASVSQLFGFNASYLSRKFKQATEKSFVEYLTECRMKKATEYALLDKKMFWTAAEVGIPDPNYFSRCFKKYAGMSYSEYVASHMEK